MNNRPTVSVIVPVYNNCDTLVRCLDSIRRQSFADIEVIMVDDGSEDGCPAVMRSFAKSDPRFIPIFKAHSGVSDSRNAAIDKARGKYLQFVDSDDYITPDATESLVSAAESSGCDMVIADYYRINGDRIHAKGHIKVGGPVSAAVFADYMKKAPANFYYGVMWNKLFRAELVHQNEIRCSEELNWCEDFQFNLRYLKYVSSVFVLTKPIYYYVNTPGSLVNSPSNIPKAAKTKLTLYDDYQEVYKTLDLFRFPKLRLLGFFFDFARDKTKIYTVR